MLIKMSNCTSIDYVYIDCPVASSADVSCTQQHFELLKLREIRSKNPDNGFSLAFFDAQGLTSLKPGMSNLQGEFVGGLMISKSSLKKLEGLETIEAIGLSDKYGAIFLRSNILLQSATALKDTAYRRFTGSVSYTSFLDKFQSAQIYSLNNPQFACLPSEWPEYDQDNRTMATNLYGETVDPGTCTESETNAPTGRPTLYSPGEFPTKAPTSAPTLAPTSSGVNSSASTTDGDDDGSSAASKSNTTKAPLSIIAIVCGSGGGLVVGIAFFVFLFDKKKRAVGVRSGKLDDRSLVGSTSGKDRHFSDAEDIDAASTTATSQSYSVNPMTAAHSAAHSAAVSVNNPTADGIPGAKQKPIFDPDSGYPVNEEAKAVYAREWLDSRCVVSEGNNED
jgi:hypothetical protein